MSSPDPTEASRTFLTTILRNNRGATAVEYGLIVAIVGAAVVAGASQIDPGFAEVGDDFQTAVASTDR